VAVGAALATAFVRIRPDTAGFGRELDSQVRREADGQRTGEKIGRDLGQGISKGVSPLITSAVALGPALLPVLAASTAAAGGLGVALASGGAALGVFGAVAVTSFKAIQDNLKLAGKGTEDLTSPVGRATTAYEGLTGAWDKFVAHNQPAVFRSFGAGFSILTTAIPKLQPLFDVASEAVLRFEGQLSHFVSGGGMDRLVRFLTANAAPALEAFRQTFTNIGAGIGALSPQFARFSGAVETGMVGLSAKFAAWAQNAGPGGGFQRFINYVVGVGPTIVSTFHELASAVVNIGKGMAPLGPVSLSFVGAMARLVSVLPPGVITGIAAGFLGLQGALKLSAAASQLFNRSFGATPIGLAALALTGLIGVFVHHAQVVAESRARTEEFRTTLDKTTGAITLDTRAMAAHALQTSGALDAAQKLGLGLATITDAAVGNQAAMGQVNSAVAAARDRYAAFVGTGQQMDKGLADQQLAAGILTKALGGTSAEVSNAQGKQRQLAAATQPTTVAIVSQKDAAANAKRALDQLSGALLKVAGVNLTAEQSEIQFRDSLASLTQSVKDNGRSLDINTSKGRANRSAVLDSISAALQHADAVGKQTGSQTKAQQAFQNSIPAIREQARRLGLNRSEVDKLIRSIGGLKPKTVPVTVAIRGQDVTLTGGRVSVAGAGGTRDIRQTGNAYGGWVAGNSPNDRADNIPVWMTGQEFVIQRPTARKIQRQAPGFLDALNQGALDIAGDPAAMLAKFAAKINPLHFARGGSIPGFATGGFVRAEDGSLVRSSFYSNLGPGLVMAEDGSIVRSSFYSRPAAPRPRPAPKPHYTYNYMPQANRHGITPAIQELFAHLTRGGPILEDLSFRGESGYYRAHNDAIADLFHQRYPRLAWGPVAQQALSAWASRWIRRVQSGQPALGFAQGGSIPSVQQFLKQQDPKPYIWGGTGPGGWDCSGLAGAAYGLLTGMSPYRRYFTTASNFAALGFRRGLGTFTMGVNPGHHMDVNLAGFGAEAASTATGIHTGSAATPVTRFAQQWFLPQVGGQFVAGGGFPGLTGPQIRKVVSLMRPSIISAIFKELGVRQADSGAWLPPHSVAAFHNNTDKWEPVGPPGASPGGDGPWEISGTLRLEGGGTAQLVAGQIARAGTRGRR
jgi:hypothetical protein